jgi:hypothetical protein
MSRHRRQQRRRAGRAFIRAMKQRELGYQATKRPVSPNTVATADALFSALGFRRVEE